MKIFNAFRSFIECQNMGIPYKLKNRWYNQMLHQPTTPIQIQIFRHNGVYISPEEGNIIQVVIVTPEKRYYCRYIITKVYSKDDLHKKIYDYDNVHCNLKFHSLMYTI